jgi:hypothetical protein
MMFLILLVSWKVVRMDFEISRANALDGLIISQSGGKKIAVTAAVTVQD